MQPPCWKLMDHFVACGEGLIKEIVDGGVYRG